MLTKLLLLAQKTAPAPGDVEQPSAFFTLTNLILALAIIAILVGYKVYKDKTMK